MLAGKGTEEALVFRPCNGAVLINRISQDTHVEFIVQDRFHCGNDLRVDLLFVHRESNQPEQPKTNRVQSTAVFALRKVVVPPAEAAR